MTTKSWVLTPITDKLLNTNDRTTYKLIKTDKETDKKTLSTNWKETNKEKIDKETISTNRNKDSWQRNSGF